MKYNDKHTIYKLISDIFLKHQQYEFVQDKDFNKIQSIMESESMDISDQVKIKYSRRPDLVKSFQESKQDPLIIVDKEVNSMAVISEISCNYQGVKQKCFYTSDLRIAKKSSLRFKVHFRKFYLSMIKQIPNSCFTAILKQNTKAINSLSGGKGGLFYTPLLEYLSRSVFVLPTLLLLRPRKLEQSYNIVPANHDYEAYLSKKLKTIYFAHEISRDDEKYLIKKNGIIKGYFSIKRPKYRSLLIEVQNKALNVGIHILGKILKKDYSQKIPWVYLTNLYIDNDIDQSEILPYILKYLYLNKRIRNGEVFLICHDIKNKYRLSGLFPQMKITGILFDVSDEKKEEYPDKEFHINPLYL